MVGLGDFRGDSASQYSRYVTAKCLINASLFQSSLRRKWSGSTSTNPDKATLVLCMVSSVLQGVSEGGDNIYSASLFSFRLPSRFSPPLRASGFLAPLAGRPTRLFCLASRLDCDRTRRFCIIPRSFINSPPLRNCIPLSWTQVVS